MLCEGGDEWEWSDSESGEGSGGTVEVGVLARGFRKLCLYRYF